MPSGQPSCCRAKVTFGSVLESLSVPRRSTGRTSCGACENAIRANVVVVDSGVSSGAQLLRLARPSCRRLRDRGTACGSGRTNGRSTVFANAFRQARSRCSGKSAVVRSASGDQKTAFQSVPGVQPSPDGTAGSHRRQQIRKQVPGTNERT